MIFTRGNGGSPVELVVPTGGVLQEFNRGAGGLHRVALQLDSLEAIVSEMLERGFQQLESEPERGEGPFLGNYLSPVHAKDFLVEFVQELETPQPPTQCATTTMCPRQKRWRTKLRPAPTPIGSVGRQP